MQTYTTGISLGVSAPILQVWVEYSTLVSVLIPDTGIGASLLQLLLLLITVIIILIILPHILTWLSGSYVKSIETCVGYFFQYLSSRLVLSGVEGSWCCSVPALTLPVRSREKQISILVLILFSSAPCSCVSSSSPPATPPPCTGSMKPDALVAPINIITPPRTHKHSERCGDLASVSASNLAGLQRDTGEILLFGTVVDKLALLRWYFLGGEFWFYMNNWDKTCKAGVQLRDFKKKKNLKVPYYTNFKYVFVILDSTECNHLMSHFNNKVVVISEASVSLMTCESCWRNVWAHCDITKYTSQINFDLPRTVCLHTHLSEQWSDHRHLRTDFCPDRVHSRTRHRE